MRSRPSKGPPGRLRRAGKRILEWLLATPSGAKAAPAPAPDWDPPQADPPPFAPILYPVERRPWPPAVSEEEFDPSGPPVLYQTLRDRIVDVWSLLRRVKDEMSVLAECYRSEVPPTRLQLCPWGFPKGTPPRALYWVRLARKQEAACDDRLQVRPLGRPRWFRRLKIRTRTDLRNAVHWNGLDAHKTTLLRYHDLASFLNRAHRILSRRSAYLVRAFGRDFGGVGGLDGCPDLPLGELAYDLLSGAGCRLRQCAWRMQWAVDTELARLNRLSGPSGGPVFRLEHLEAGENGVPERFVWVNGETRLAVFNAGVRRGTKSCQDELMKLLDARMKIVHLVLSRLREIHESATFEMDVFRYSAPPRPPGAGSAIVS